MAKRFSTSPEYFIYTTLWNLKSYFCENFNGENHEVHNFYLFNYTNDR